MKKRLKRAAGIFLSVCMMFSLLPVSSSVDTVEAAGNGTLQNGALEGTGSDDEGWAFEGWDLTGEYGYKYKEGGLDLYGEEAGAFSISQTVENMAAGRYSVKVSIVGDEGNTNPLKLTIQNNNSKTEKSVQLVADGWHDDWAANHSYVTEAVDVAAGDSVTVTIGGNVPAAEWYRLTNVALEAAASEGNGTLKNGELTSGIDGWDITGTTYGYNFDDKDGLNMWGNEAGTVRISQTVENMAAGDYKAQAAIIGDADQTEWLNLTIKNEQTGAEESVQLVCEDTTGDNWDNDWGVNKVRSTKPVAVAAGDSVTVTINGNVAAQKWNRIKNVQLMRGGQEDSVVKNAPINVRKIDGLSKDFIHGVDVSMYLSEVQSGVKYYDENGQEQNLFKILSDAGVNYVRLRLWNCPYAVDDNGNYKYVNADGTIEYTTDANGNYNYTDANGTKHDVGSIKVKKPDATGDNASGKEWEEYFLDDGTQVYREGYGAGNCGIDTVEAIGKVATDYGMKVLIDFHYSDFWADPKKQSVPKEWDGMTLDEKTEALSAFTEESLNTLRNAGVDVGMVQIGNEINNGMAGELIETGEANVLKMLKAASAAVRKVDTDILIAVHYTDPQQEGYQMKKAAALKNAGVEYDVFATSYYPFWHGTPEKLTANLKEIADTYNKKVMVAEVSYAWTNDDGDGYPNVVNPEAGDQEYNYQIDIEGQATAIRDTIAAVSAVGDKGIGTFYWEPAWVPVNVYKDAQNPKEVLEKNQNAWRMYGSGWGSIYAKEIDPEIKDDHNGSTWDNQAFFDFTGKALPSLNVYKWVYTGAEGPKRVSTVDKAQYTMDYKSNPRLPETVNVNINDGTVISAPVVWDAEQTQQLKTAEFGEYTVDGTVGAFTYNDGTKDVTVSAGTWTTTCLVRIAGNNYVKNGSFEDNGGSTEGWTLTNLIETEGEGGVNIDKGSANAKDGLYYVSGWALVGKPVKFNLKQTISEKLQPGKYSLVAWYQGTSVDDEKNDSILYADVVSKDGSTKRYSAEVKITNVWKDFYKAIVKDIPVDENTVSVTVGTEVSAQWKEGSAQGTWVVVDDISFMSQGEEDVKDVTYQVTFKDGDAVLSTQTVRQGTAATAPAAPTKAGYTFAGWDQAFTNVTGNLTVNAKWEAGKYNITYDVNGGKKLSSVSKTVTYEQLYGELPSPKREGYTFEGWYTAKTGGAKITASDKVNITGNATLYAHWKKVTVAKAKKPTVKKASKTSIKVSFKKVKDAKGYRITYSTSKKFTKKTTKSVTTTKLKTTIKKLKKNKTYYVKVQAYKKDSANKNVYGKYSAVKSIKLK